MCSVSEVRITLLWNIIIMFPSSWKLVCIWGHRSASSELVFLLNYLRIMLHSSLYVIYWKKSRRVVLPRNSCLIIKESPYILRSMMTTIGRRPALQGEHFSCTTLDVLSCKDWNVLLFSSLESCRAPHWGPCSSTLGPSGDRHVRNCSLLHLLLPSYTCACK